MSTYGISTQEWHDLEVEVLDLFSRLLQCETVNPPGNETACAELLRDYLAANGIESILVGEPVHRQNLVARLQGRRPGPRLLFTGHTDTVPVDAPQWTVPPFSGAVKDGYVWGCGAVDMKNQIAAEAVALVRLARSGADFAGEVIFAATADEEVGQDCGARWLCQNRPELVACDYIINEGSGGLWLPIGDQKVFLLAVGEKAFAQFRITTRGRGGHGSVPEHERSAVIDLAKVVIALGQYEPPAQVSELTASFIDALIVDPQLREDLKDPERARSAARLLRERDPIISELVEPLLGATFTPTLLKAGQVVNVIPTHAEVDVDCRILPGMTLDEVRATVASVLDPLGIDWEFEWVDVTEPNESPAESALTTSIARVLTRDVPGAALVPMCSCGFTDSRWYREYFPDCIAYGFAPYIAEGLEGQEGGRDHMPDERIMVEDVTYQALFFERLARDLLA